LAPCLAKRGLHHSRISNSDSRVNENGNANSAWTLNASIWEKIVHANTKKDGLARRYVHVSNFETAHGVILTGKEKPLRAYEYVVAIGENDDVPCLNYLRDLLGQNAILHDDAFVDALP
jgi:putative ATP-dependent endonuclease of the OLD family